MSDARDRLLALLKDRSYREGEVVLASGKKSDFFIDCKRTVMTAEGQRLAGQVVFESLTAADLERAVALAAVPLGGCPLVSAASLIALSHGVELHLLFVRPERKDHGTAQRIEGAQNLDSAGSVVLVEDVVTTGGSSIRAVEALRSSGFDVPFVLVLVDRLEGGREALSAAGVELRSVYTRHDFVVPR